jgi:hypothetical protein
MKCDSRQNIRQNSPLSIYELVCRQIAFRPSKSLHRSIPHLHEGGISVMSVIQTRLSSTGLNGLFNVLGRTSCDRLVVKKMNIIADNQQNKNLNKINGFSE